MLAWPADQTSRGCSLNGGRLGGQLAGGTPWLALLRLAFIFCTCLRTRSSEKDFSPTRKATTPSSSAGCHFSSGTSASASTSGSAMRTRSSRQASVQNSLRVCEGLCSCMLPRPSPLSPHGWNIYVACCAGCRGPDTAVEGCLRWPHFLAGAQNPDRLAAET